MGRRKHSFLSIFLKSQIFIHLKIGRNGGNEIRFSEFFIKLPKYPYIFNPLILNRGLIVILS